MRIVLTLLFNLALVPVAAAADLSTDATVIKDMVVLDKAYVPALMITKDGDIAHAEKAVGRLVASWTEFRDKWQGTVAEEWGSDFERIDELVAESAKVVSISQDLKRAHRLLDEVRHILARLRREKGVEYYVDRLTFFDDALTDVVRSVVKDKHETMTTDELDLAENVLLEATRRWKIILDTYMDKIVYRIDYYSMGEFNYSQTEVSRLLEEVIEDLRTEDRMVLADKVEAIRANFEHLLKLFGEYDGLE